MAGRVVDGDRAQGLPAEVRGGHHQHRVQPALEGDGGGGAVAFWAHVWGFIFGTSLAWAIGLLGIDGRLAARTAVSEPVDTGTSDPDPRPVPERRQR